MIRKKREGDFMRALLIAEKPSLMRDIQAVYNKHGHADKIDFKTFAGHTMGLSPPHVYTEEWKKWRLDTLPMIPETFQYEPTKDKYAMYKDIKETIKVGGYDYIINACDPGREGQHIFFSFYDSLGVHLPVKRMWHRDLTEGELKRALDHLRDETEDELMQMTIASKYRAYFDWLIGLSGTRAVSIKANKKINIGRVMTPTLKLIVDRENEISNFKPQDFYEVELDFNGYKGVYQPQGEDESGRFFNKKEAETFLGKLEDKGDVVSVEKKLEKKHAPALHSLQELSNEANRVYGYTMSETLKLAQQLYEKKYLSYPRTDSRHLTSAIAKDFNKSLQAITVLPELTATAQTVMGQAKLLSDVAKNKKYVNDKKVTDHYAIIPTGVKPVWAKLSKPEQNIFTLVAKRFLAIFMPPMQVKKTKITTAVSDGQQPQPFVSNGNILVDLGYMSLYPYNKNNTELPNVTKGETREVITKDLLAKKTTAPSRYTDETLGKAMEHAGRFVEDEDLASVLKDTKGLGTPATRGNIVEKLVKLEMVERKKKAFYATDFGLTIIEMLKDKDITLPELTGTWEQRLSQIESGDYAPDQFYQEMIAYVQAMIEDLKQTPIKQLGEPPQQKARPTIGKCPQCGKKVVETKNYYLCEGYKESCNFIVGKEILGTKIPKTEVKKILKGEKTKPLTFTWKSGKKGEASLQYDEEKKNVGFVFN